MKKKNIGIVRELDDLGRITLPIGFRRELSLICGSKLAISMREDGILLTPYEETCIFCGSAEELTDVLGKKVCQSCASKLK